MTWKEVGEITVSICSEERASDGIGTLSWWRVVCKGPEQVVATTGGNPGMWLNRSWRNRTLKKEGGA